MREEPHAIPEIEDQSPRKQGVPLRVLHAIDSAIVKVEKILLFVLVFFILGAVTLGIAARMANWSLPGAMEAGVFAMFIVALLSGSVATHYRRHISVDVLTRAMPGSLRTIVSVVINLIGGILMLYLVRASVFFVEVNRLGSEYTSPGLGIPYWWVQAPIPILFGIIAFRFFLNGADDFRRVLSREWLPQDPHQHGADIRM